MRRYDGQCDDKAEQRKNTDRDKFQTNGDSGARSGIRGTLRPQLAPLIIRLPLARFRPLRRHRRHYIFPYDAAPPHLSL
jgi:hypothetical protein